MALTVETGIGLETADTFVDVAQVRVYASSYGATLPEDDEEVEVLIRRAHNYLQTLEDRFQGDRSKWDQGLLFPRTGVVVHGHELPSDAIPAILKKAVNQLVCDLTTVDLTPTTDGRVALEETVGPLKVVYSETLNSSTPGLPAFLGIIRPLFKASTNELIRA